MTLQVRTAYADSASAYLPPWAGCIPTTVPMREPMVDFYKLNDEIGTAALLEEWKRYG
jgi:hypothetical protein